MAEAAEELAASPRPALALAPDPLPERIVFAVVHGDVRHSTFDDSKDALIAYDRAHDGYLSHDASRIFTRAGTDGLVAARNTTVERFLETGADWLFWVDSDMGLAPDTLAQLRAAADVDKAPIVGGLCFASRQVAHDGLSGFRTRPLPTIYQWVETDGVPTFVSQLLYPVNAVVRVAGTGSACILIHRTVFDKIGQDWYVRVPAGNGKLLGEDISFCVRASAAGIPIHVNTAVKTTHVKPQWVAEADHWRSYVAPPATDEAAVLLPTGGGMPPMFRASLAASTSLARVRTPDSGTPWVVFARSEHRFHAGWLDHAEHVAEELDATVVALNDLTPQALAGVGSSAFLVRREMYEEHDRSLAACIKAAIRHGQYTIALGSVVELTHD